MRLRVAQADDALTELRCLLRILATLCDYKKTQIGGTSQRMSLRSGDIIRRFADKTHHCAARYCAAYKALTLLDPEGDWKSRLRHLSDDDIRSPHRVEDEPSEGDRELSWIWLAPRAGGRPIHATTPDEVNDRKSNICLLTWMYAYCIPFRYAC